MPCYDYKCGECGESFEIICGINDDRSGIKCTKCGSDKVERNFGSVYLPKKAKAKGGGDMGSSGMGGSKSCSTCSATSCATCG